jgi:hypothetical protein
VAVVARSPVPRWLLCRWLLLDSLVRWSLTPLVVVLPALRMVMSLAPREMNVLLRSPLTSLPQMLRLKSSLLFFKRPRLNVCTLDHST